MTTWFDNPWHTTGLRIPHLGVFNIDERRLFYFITKGIIPKLRKYPSEEGKDLLLKTREILHVIRRKRIAQNGKPPKYRNQLIEYYKNLNQDDTKQNSGEI